MHHSFDYRVDCPALREPLPRKFRLLRFFILPIVLGSAALMATFFLLLQREWKAVDDLSTQIAATKAETSRADMQIVLIREQAERAARISDWVNSSPDMPRVTLLLADAFSGPLNPQQSVSVASFRMRLELGGRQVGIDVEALGGVNRASALLTEFDMALARAGFTTLTMQMPELDRGRGMRLVATYRMPLLVDFLAKATDEGGKDL